MKKLPLSLAVITAALLLISSSISASIKIGVNAPRGPLKAHVKWDEMASYIGLNMGKEVKIVPIDAKKADALVENKMVDFVLVNPMMTYSFQQQYGAEPLATTNFKKNGPFLGGVIIASKDSGAKTLDDLKDKDVLAYKIGASAAAYAFQTKHLLDQGINAHEDFASFRGAKRQDEIVLAVKNGLADAGFVKTGLIESMVKEGKLKLSDITVIENKKSDDYPLVHSTFLYPGWTMSKLKDTDAEVSEKLKTVLMDMPEDSAASKKAQLIGFIAPPSFDEVGDMMKTLELGPYKK